jgi:hypothetical protein
MSNLRTSQDRLRVDRNRELIRRMNAGENLNSFSSASSWFPPRPIIEKDPKALAQLYGSDRMTPEQHQSTAGELNKVETAEETEASSKHAKVVSLRLA